MKEINKKSYNLMLRALSTFGNEVFTSNKFTDACRDWGVSSYMLTSNNNTRTKFLHTHCLQLGGAGSKTWQRKALTPFGEFNIKSNNQQLTPALNEAECIEFLKSKGYKIYKTIEL